MVSSPDELWQPFIPATGMPCELCDVLIEPEQAVGRGCSDGAGRWVHVVRLEAEIAEQARGDVQG